MLEQTDEIIDHVENEVDPNDDSSILHLVEVTSVCETGYATQPPVDKVAAARACLAELLASERGCVSSRMLRERLEEDEELKGDARQLVIILKSMHPYQIGRSFYSKEAFELEQTVQKAEEANLEAQTEDELKSEGQTNPAKKENRR